MSSISIIKWACQWLKKDKEITAQKSMLVQAGRSLRHSSVQATSSRTDNRFNQSRCPLQTGDKMKILV